MIKPRAILLTSLAALVLAGCGVQPTVGLGAGADYEAQVQGRKLRYGLGANLKGTPKVRYDEGSTEMADAIGAFSSLPSKADLRRQCPPIYNQGTMGSCTGFAIAKGLGEFILKKQHRHTELSALYLYYMERKAQHSIDEDAGASISVGMRILDNIGVAPEKDHPYPPKSAWKSEKKMHEYLVMKPDSSDEKDGKSYRVKGLKPIRSLHAIRASVAKGMPVVFGIEIYESFYDAKKGLIPTPNTSKEKLLGGHAVMCVGYDNNKHVLIMRNSWGADWGDDGYFYLPYDFIREGLAHDAWTAKI